MNGPGRSPEALRVECSQLRAFYRWALLERLITEDPTVRLVLPKVVRGLPRPITDAKLAEALAGAEPAIKAILALAAFAGLRACEIARLDWAEVGIVESPHLRVLDGKGGKGRIIPISTALAAALAELPHRRGPVITRADGRPGYALPHRISQRANDYLHEAGVTDLHQCRHRFATAASSLRDIRAVQDLLGHASPTTTSRYAAVASGIAIDAVEAAGTLRVDLASKGIPQPGQIVFVL